MQRAKEASPPVRLANWWHLSLPPSPLEPICLRTDLLFPYLVLLITARYPMGHYRGHASIGDVIRLAVRASSRTVEMLGPASCSLLQVPQLLILSPKASFFCLPRLFALFFLLSTIIVTSSPGPFVLP